MNELNLELQINGIIEKTVSIEGDNFIIGRLLECDLQLPFSDISRHHTRLFKAPSGEWFVEDMGSTNGTLLNNSPLSHPHAVNQGDVIYLGHRINLIVVLADRADPQLPEIGTMPEGVTILGKAKELQKQWIEPDTKLENNYEQAISRLKYLVDIAKYLNTAESIEAIFDQVQQIVFRDIKNIERLALLIDFRNKGELEVVKTAAKQTSKNQCIPTDGSWIGRTICRKVFAEQVAIKTADAQMDEQFDDNVSMIDKGIRTAIAVPLWDENTVFGVLYGDAHLTSREWYRGGDEDLSFFSALGNIVASSVQRWLLAQKLRSEEIMRQRLERYHSPAVVQHLMKTGTLINHRLPPVEREISILFADIVGFTAMSERLSPPQIARLLNNFFEEMLQEVFGEGGTLDKFIGDCIMAFFGAPEPQLDHADRAVAAALGMLNRLDQLNAHNILGEPLQLRISINSGKAIIGDVGSSKRVDYTVLGSTINLAARMEGICLPGECVVSEATYNLLKDPESFEPMGEFRFKGIERPVTVYNTQRNIS
jgi:adenylate cyclase